jgi:acetolactate synthase-1/2/3 large subunit
MNELARGLGAGKVRETAEERGLSTPAASKVKVSDYVARFLADRGVRHVFMVTGGGAMHLNDSLGHEARLECVFQHHEQACSIAAEGYARVSNAIGVLNVTTGPGGINALNGVFGAWTDSIPMFVVSGQVRRDTCLALSPVEGLRQLGDQEVDIVRIARGITKYAVLISDPLTIRFHLEKAFHLALEGRPGPVWVDIPVDVQGAYVDPDELQGFEPEPVVAATQPDLAPACKDILERIRKAERPVIMIGTGVRIAGALPLFERVVRKLGIPVTTAWTAVDSFPSDDPLYCGRPGTIGNRGGNFTTQNADFLIIVGCRLALRQISYNWGSFARAAYKVIVDVDPAELKKPMVRPDMPIVSDAKVFFEALERQIDHDRPDPGQHSAWVNWCKERLDRYPVVRPEQRLPKGDRLNPYHFLDRMFDLMDEDAVVACGDATANVVAFQVAKVKAGQRFFGNAGCASMGYDLPAAIGAAVARGGKPVICLAGDGSLQVNIQELQTVVHNQLPVKLFVMNNDGYLSMRLTQDNFFKRRTGEGPKTGVSFPDIVKVASAYGLPTFRIDAGNMNQLLPELMRREGPFVCDVLLDPDQGFEPKLGSRQRADGSIVSAQLEDMAPLLSPEELAENMLIAPPE